MIDYRSKKGFAILLAALIILCGGAVATWFSVTKGKATPKVVAWRIAFKPENFVTIIVGDPNAK